MVVIIPVLTCQKSHCSITSTTTGCIPNIELSITSDPNSFQWVYNGQDIPGAITRIHQACEKRTWIL
jgi:hypothetical protein